MSNDKEKSGFFTRLKKGLTKTHKVVIKRLDEAAFGNREISEELLDTLEEILITSDIGISTVQTLMDKIHEGRRIDNMYDIKDYLICKKEGKPWIKRPGAENFRSDMKQRVLEVERSFSHKGYQFYK